MDKQHMEQVFQDHHSKASMMLARSRINPNPVDPHYGYRDLARYVQDGFTEPFDKTDLYLRLLACAKAERTALPTIAHMQSLMSMVWAPSVVPSKYEAEFHRVCHHVSEALCYDIGKYATESMKNLAQTLRVELQVQMGYEQDATDAMALEMDVEEPGSGPPPTTAPVPAPDDAPPIAPGKPTLH